MKPTITDIAKKANVSITAVSFALNNKNGVSTETAKKIISIARDINYPIPQQQPQANIIKAIKIVKHGQILNEHHDPFIGEYLDGMTQYCKEYNQRMELQSYRQENIPHIIEDIVQSDAAGIIIIATELDKEDISIFSSIKKPLCFIDANYDFLPFSFVDIDNINNVYMLICYLKGMGHTHIGMVSSSYSTPNFHERELAFPKVLAQLNLPYSQEHVVHISPHLSQGFMDMNHMIHMLPTLPTAFFCVNDIIAYNVMKALQLNHIAVPDKVSVVGIDDLPGSKICEPALTTIRVSNYQIGMRALQLLNQQIISGNERATERISVSGNLIIRKSVLYRKEK